ncbi:MAG: UvrD-helicase domain-containing protein [Bacteroidales bacterium]|nr:UvrD-helicase domain-containing protein [Bacteroidales bacterium]MCB8999722.1 UvrD-helicase domain-containing protein [Bacteroidales bacterium]MCB9013118.1 UvrD-helicase domain-containing protein [Bacteroidales bacterium]
MRELIKDLNKEQQEAVFNYKGASLVIAGAGSGKTRVLTYRIAHMLTEGVHPASILALTFTNKAANEMKTRIADLVGRDAARKLWMGTFHSVFARILRIESAALSYPSDYTIYDTTDSKNLIKTIVKEMKLDDKIYKTSEVLGRISNAKNNLVTPEAYAASSEIATRDNASRRPMMAVIYKHYAARCRKAGAMDFDDLLLNTNILFRDHPKILQKYQQAFRYILVDEYQDTNYSQYLIIKRLAENHSNVCVVGDDAQSIYSFRGARIENILNFKRDYPEAVIHKLERNYRSTRTIVNAANSVIANNRDQIHKKVYSEKAEGEKIRIIEARADNEEGFLIASLIKDLLFAKQYQYKDIAILYRTNAQSRIFEESLRKMNIPYKIYGGVSFFQRKEIKDILAYFKLIVNTADEEAFKRIINYPLRGIGKTTVLKLEELALAMNLTIWDVIGNDSLMQANFNKGVISKIQAFKDFINEYMAKLDEMEAFDIAFTLLSSLGILKELRDDKTPEGISRYENAEALLNGIREFTESPEEETQRGLADYLQTVTLLTDADTEKPEDYNRVTLMTIHSAKGLEFKHVCIVGVEEELFPSHMSVTLPSDLEEERRLFYVALTRAEDSISLSYANTRYKWGLLGNCNPSRFISEISETYLDYPLPLNSGPQPKPNTGNDFSKTSKPYGSGAASTGFLKERRLVRMDKPVQNGSTESSDPSQIRPGQHVEHPRFGIGEVLILEGDKATVEFPGHGKKQLLLKFAKLKIVN